MAVFVVHISALVAESLLIILFRAEGLGFKA